MNLMSPVFPLAVVAALAASTSIAAQWTHGPPPVVDEAATKLDRLGAEAALDVSFVDEHGTPVVLRDFADGSLPIVLNLGYFNCPGMCGFVLNQFLQHLEGSGLTPGRDFRLLTLSVHHAEGPQLALEKKQTYVDNLGAPAWTADWPFLTGDEASIRALTDSVGWRFRFDEFARDVDHPPTLVLLSPTGKVARYLDARQLTPSTVRRGIIEAGPLARRRGSGLHEGSGRVR